MILILGLNSLKCVFCLQCSKNCTILIFEAILYSLLFQGRQRRDDRSLSARKPKTLQLTARRRSWFEQSVASDVSNSRVRLIQGVFLTPPLLKFVSSGKSTLTLRTFFFFFFVLRDLRATDASFCNSSFLYLFKYYESPGNACGMLD